MEERLDSLEKKDINDMANVMIHLADYCADNDKIFLGVSHRLNLGCSERPLCTESESSCQYDANWLTAFIEVYEASQWSDCAFVVWGLRNGQSGCLRNCSTSGRTEIKEEEWSLRLKDGNRGEREGSAIVLFAFS